MGLNPNSGEKMRKRLFDVIFIGLFFFNAFLSASDWNIQKEFYDAIKSNNIKKIESILEKNPELVNKKIKYHNYPVLDAAKFGNFEIVKLLVENGAVIDKKESKTGNTIIHFATNKFGIPKEKRDVFFEYLIKEKKFNIDVKNNAGQTPFNYAFTSRDYPPTVKGGIDVILLFDSYKANLNAQDASGKTVLNYLLGDIRIHSVDPAKTNLATLKIARVLIEKGADVNIADKEKRTPLVTFLVHTKRIPEKLRVDFVTVLMENGAKIKLKSKNGEKALKLVKKKGKLYKAMKKVKKRK
jgi:ankyrin repeat protein